MCVKVEPTYYRLELDDYSAAAFTSFGKYYYGTLEDLRCFFGELAHDEKDHKASPLCTCYTGKSRTLCLLLSIVPHFCFFRIAVLWFLRIEYLHIIQTETSQSSEDT